MAKFTISKTIHAPSSAVFDAFTDLEHAAERIRGIERIEMLTDGPMAVGTRWRETRRFLKKAATEVMEVSDFQPGRSYQVTAASCGAEYLTGFEFTPHGDATRVDVEFVATPVTFIAKLMSPLTRVMLGTCRKAFDRDLEDLKSLLEGDVEGVPA